MRFEVFPRVVQHSLMTLEVSRSLSLDFIYRRFDLISRLLWSESCIGAITNGLMSDEGAIQAGCGAYTYSIGGAEMLPPPPTNEYPGAETGPSAMIKSFIHSTQVFPLRCLKRQDPEKNWKKKNPYDNGNLFKTDIVGHRADLFCNLLDAEEVFLGPNLPSQAKYFRMLPDETLHHQIEVGFRVEWVDNCVSEFQQVKVKDFYGCRIFFQLNHQNCKFALRSSNGIR